MASQTFSVSLPVEGGKLNCTLARPTLGLIKQFRQAARKVLTLNASYSALVVALQAASQTIPMPDLTAQEAALNQADEDGYQALIDQASLVLVPVSFTLDNGTVADPNTPTPTLDDVDWDSVENATLQSITQSFQSSIGG